MKLETLYKTDIKFYKNGPYTSKNFIIRNPKAVRTKKQWTKQEIYGVENKRLDVYKRNVLRRVFATIQKDDSSYKLRYNEEYMNQFEKPSVSSRVKIRQLKWVEDVKYTKSKNSYRHRKLEVNSVR